MTTLEILKIRLKNKNKIDIVKKLKYNNIDIGLLKLNELINSNSIESWLLNSHYDFKYSSEEYLINLFNILELDINLLNKELYNIKYIKNLQSPYISIKTDFIRKNEPIIALGLMSPLKKIKINKDELLNTKNEKVFIYNIILKHFYNNKGVLKLWGNIIEYEYKSPITKEIYKIHRNDIPLI